MCLVGFNMDIPQGQKMGLEVKSGSLVAGRGQPLSCGEGAAPDLATQLGLSPWFGGLP